jgi:low temperature requirement protein LtrA
MKTPENWWRPPRLRIGEGNAGQGLEKERHATWMELFYDLVFVAAVAQLGLRLNRNVSAPGFMEFLILFVPVWWSWMGAAFFATRFDSDDPLHRLLTGLQMAAVAGLAVNVHDGLGRGSAAFGLSYACVRGILVVEYIRAGRHVPAARRLTSRYAWGFGVAGAIWFGSAFVPIPLRFAMWALGLAVDFGTPLTAGRLHAELAPHPSHLPERFGLFTLIVLGESVMAVVAGVAKYNWDFLSAVTAALGLSIAFSLWWIYFDTMDDTPIRGVRSEGGVRLYHLWLYAHLPLVAGLAATGVGVQRLITTPQGLAAPGPTRWLFCGSLAMCMLALSLIHIAAAKPTTLRCSRASALHHAGAAVALLVIALLGARLIPIIMIALTAVICAVQIAADLPCDTGT